ncbi:hypothetical protein K491DRAFT_426798 [Lophiostoma macrostomum CBS 122681]|uniref:Uncharacterized protein n=1 Tax=Lophiostoma macrostomum CBS 122681 TaxID=1314788 RepID=A0A6A6T692_9PLEO|nr:hypothetical protein K491DRAFT_426798 [Lophiostoma macrostomum CBS 122681]
MRAAFCDQMQRRKNETLLALILLDLGERIEYARMNILPSVEHYKAAMALVLERDLESFRDDMSQSLLNAVRYIVVRKALWASSEAIDLGVFSCLEKGRAETHTVALDLDHIVSRVLVLRNQVSASLWGEYRGTPWALNQLSITRRLLDTQLVEWIKSVPANWHPFLQSNTNFGTSSWRRDLVEIYSSYEVALIYNHCRCVQLLLLGISQSLPSPVSDANVTRGIETSTNIQERA